MLSAQEISTVRSSDMWRVGGMTPGVVSEPSRLHSRCAAGVLSEYARKVGALCNEAPDIFREPLNNLLI